MNENKVILLHELRDARSGLWNVLEGITPAFEIYPGWTKREFFAHIAGWEGVCFDLFRAYIAGALPKPYPYSGLDNANAHFVRSRQMLPLDDAKLECEINRFALETLLESIPEIQYSDPVVFPWGTDTISEWLRGSVKHERDHAAELSTMIEGERS